MDKDAETQHVLLRSDMLKPLGRFEGFQSKGGTFFGDAWMQKGCTFLESSV